MLGLDKINKELGKDKNNTTDVYQEVKDTYLKSYL